MFFSNVTLRDLVANEVLQIRPMPDHRAFQPAGIDLRLHDHFIIPPAPTAEELKDPHYVDKLKYTDHHGSYCLLPGACVLGATLEQVYVPKNMVMFVHGKSSLGRVFLSVHQTAGLVDANFHGRVTLEFVNHSKVPIWLHPGMFICQVTVAELSTEARPAYGDARLDNHYQGQKTTAVAHFDRRMHNA